MSADRAAAATPSLIDPVCGMAVTVLSTHVFQHEGKLVYFRNAG